MSGLQELDFLHKHGAHQLLVEILADRCWSERSSRPLQNDEFRHVSALESPQVTNQNRIRNLRIQSIPQAIHERRSRSPTETD